MIFLFAQFWRSDSHFRSLKLVFIFRMLHFWSFLLVSSFSLFTLFLALFFWFFRVVFKTLFITLFDLHSVVVICLQLSLCFILILLLGILWPFFMFSLPILFVIFHRDHWEAKFREINNIWIEKKLPSDKATAQIPCLKRMLNATLARLPDRQWVTISFLSEFFLSNSNFSPSY